MYSHGMKFSSKDVEKKLVKRQEKYLDQQEEDEPQFFLIAKSLAEKCSYRLADIVDNIFLV